MKTFASFLTEASFSAKNFPAEYGNDRFPGAGERTTYVPDSESGDYPYKAGFRTVKAAGLIAMDKQSARTLPVGTKIWFTYPAKLFSAEEVGAKGRGIYARVSLVSHESAADGYLQISKVEKPSGNAQGRVAHGAAAQKAVDEYVQMICEQKGYTYEFVSTARPGSTIPDLTVKINGQEQQFEIKGTGSNSAPITLFDKSASRKSYPEFLDQLAEIYIKHLDGVDSAMRKGNYPLNFIGLIDYYQKEVDSKIGLAGDPGVIKSGKLPTDFRTEDPAILKEMYDFLIDHFAEGGDNYFVVYNRALGEFRLYYTEFGRNMLQASKIPNLKRFELSTYGGASSGSTRVGVKIKI